jgi:DNA-binding MarR family transcriptional regulator
MTSRLPDTPARDRPENLAILLREPYRVGSERLARRFAERGHAAVRAPPGNVFAYLDSAGTRVSVLAERAQITKQSMAELVIHLERHGYVERVPDPADRRAKLVRSTAKGEELYAIAREVVAEIEAEWTSRLGRQRIALLRELLEELNEGLDPA